MCEESDNREAASKKKKKKKKESDDKEAAAKKKKKQGRQNKKDNTQYEIEVIVGHKLGNRSKKVIRLKIKWVGDDQTTLESVKVINETVWVMVKKYRKNKYISL